MDNDFEELNDKKYDCESIGIDSFEFNVSLYENLLDKIIKEKKENKNIIDKNKKDMKN